MILSSYLLADWCMLMCSVRVKYSICFQLKTWFQLLIQTTHPSKLKEWTSNVIFDKKEERSDQLILTSSLTLSSSKTFDTCRYPCAGEPDSCVLDGSLQMPPFCELYGQPSLFSNFDGILISARRLYGDSSFFIQSKPSEQDETEEKITVGILLLYAISRRKSENHSVIGRHSLQNFAQEFSPEAKAPSTCILEAMDQIPTPQCSQEVCRICKYEGSDIRVLGCGCTIHAVSISIRSSPLVLMLLLQSKTPRCFWEFFTGSSSVRACELYLCIKLWTPIHI